MAEKHLDSLAYIAPKSKTAEKTAERLFKALLDQSGTFCMILDPNTLDGIPTIVYANQAACDAHGYTREEFIGRPVADLDDPEGKLMVRERTQQMLSGKPLHVENTHVRKDGTTFSVAVYANRVDIEGEPPLIFTTEHDITERKQAEAALAIAKEDAEKANKFKSEFLAAMSHDLRTPLNSIMGFNDIMRQQIFGALGNDHYQQYAEDIHNSGTLLLSLINDILDLSRIEAGKYDLVEELVNISSLIEASIRQLTIKAGASHQTLSVDVPDDFPHLLGDEKALLQVLNNLISNAVKFTPERGRVLTTAYLDETNAIIISVMDTGLGMSHEGISKAMRPYERPDETHSLRQESTGLGLYLCANLMKLFGGTLQIESKVDEGTTVTLRFPPERTINPS